MFRALTLLVLGISIATQAQLTWPGCPTPVDADFTKTTLISNAVDKDLQEPLRVDVDSLGRIYIALKRSGKLIMLDPALAYKKTILGTLIITPLNFHGFLGMALSPDFSRTGYIYTLTTHRALSTGPILFRISRITLKGSALDTLSQKTILEWPTELTEGHTGGDMAFGPNGTLHITTGNDTWAWVYQIPNPTQTYENMDYRTPIDEREPHYNALRTSGNTNDLRGKLLRITPIDVPASHPKVNWGSGVTYTIPNGNLYPVGTAKTRPEIYAMGLRNPYTLQVMPSGTVYLADVGPQGANTILTGPSGGDQLYIIDKPANFGFPMFVDGARPYPIYDYALKKVTGWFDAKTPINFSKFNTGLDTLPPVTPAAAVCHFEEKLNTPGWFTGGGSMVLVSGPIYRYASETTAKVRFPPHFNEKWIIADYQKSILKVVTMAGNKVVDVRSLFNTMTFANPIAMKFAPDGSLIIVEYSSLWNGFDGLTKVSRITYQGSCLPVSVAPATHQRNHSRTSEILDPSVKFLILPAEARRVELFNLQGTKVLEQALMPGQASLRLPENIRHGLLMVKYTNKKGSEK